MVESSTSAARIALGDALLARSEDVVELVRLRLHHDKAAPSTGIGAAGLASIADADRLATRLICQWLRTGRSVNPEEQRRLASLGVLADTEAVADLVKAHLSWRDAVLAVLEQECARLGTPPSLLVEVRVAVRRSCDVSTVLMAREFDLERRRLSRALAAERAKLAELALHDALTQLPNRTQLLTWMEEALATGGVLACLLLDLDGFKPVNDSYGHQAGDTLLAALALRLRRVVRSTDMVARLGGDEFVVLRPVGRFSGDDAERLAERVLAAIVQPCQIGGAVVTVAASIGIALGTAPETPASLLRRADVAMYDAKRGGGSGWRLDAGQPVH